MKRILYLVLILLSMVNTSITKEAKAQTDNDELVPFYAKHMVSCDDASYHIVEVYKSGGHYYAERIAPGSWVGNDLDTVWRIKLDSTQIAMSKAFIKTVKRVPPHCEYAGSGLTLLEVITENDTISIEGECDWGDAVDFFILWDVLFKEKELELELRRAKLVTKLTQQLKGRWYYKPLKNEPKRDDCLVLFRKKNASNKLLPRFTG